VTGDRHRVESLRVACGSLSLAAEHHGLGGERRTLVCFVPGGAIDPARERPVTSAWEGQQLSALAAAGCDGLTLNFPAIGSSSGALSDNTLARRGVWVAEILEAAVPRGERGQLVLVGTSMGAHVAAVCAARLGAARLVLVAPAAYGAAAVDAPFGRALRRVIRAPESWGDSPAFAAVRDFEGPLLMLLPELDAVIPAGVTRCYRAADGDARAIGLEGAGHRMLSGERPADRRARAVVCREIARFAAGPRPPPPQPGVVPSELVGVIVAGPVPPAGEPVQRAAAQR
jgi:pimeloyl-ACP methyl ester carboxylesterase